MKMTKLFVFLFVALFCVKASAQCALPIQQNFESNKIEDVCGALTGDITVASDYPYAGSYYLKINAPTGTATLDIQLDFLPTPPLVLRMFFRTRDFTMNTAAGNAVYLSDDGGAIWHQVTTMTPAPSNLNGDNTWGTVDYSLNIITAASGMGLDLNTSEFMIRFQADGTLSPSTIGIDNLYIGDQTENPLPISLLTFKATPGKNSVTLNWSTASEVNNDYFTILRSTDAKTWSDVATVKGAGNSNKVLPYSIIDTPGKGRYYYRLKQTDYDGKFELFYIVTALVGSASYDEAKLYPNVVPKGSSQPITMSLKNDQKVNLSKSGIYNMLEQKVSANMTLTESNEGQAVLISDYNNLPAGIYQVVVYYDNSSAASRDKLVIK